MAAVFSFSRSDNEICQDMLRVFSTGRGTAKEQWCMQAEMLVEPVGWDALWKLSKRYCREFDVRFPCIAFITVTSVDFEDLSASVDVLSVQHKSVCLPESVEDVPLIELWPTIKQREQCVNAATTAEFIDLLRFYYENIWLPWDDQEDKMLLSHTIEERMQLWSEIQNGTIPNCIGRNITMLRLSAIDTHHKLNELDSSISENIRADDDDSLLSPNYITQCAELNVRMDSFVSQWTLYENTLIREQYLAKAKKKWEINKSKRNVVALWQGGSAFEFDEVFKFLRSRLSIEQTLSIMVSAEDALALEPEELVICSTHYELPEIALLDISICSVKGCTLVASSMRSCLVSVSGACAVSGARLACAGAAGAALLARAGTLRLCACTLDDVSTRTDGHGKGTLAQGIIAMCGADIVIEDCTFTNLYTGIFVHKGAKVELRNCVLSQCSVGIQMCSGSEVVLHNTTISECSEHCIRCEVDTELTDPADVEGLQIMPDCTIGSGNLQKEVLVLHQSFE